MPAPRFRVTSKVTGLTCTGHFARKMAERKPFSYNATIGVRLSRVWKSHPLRGKAAKAPRGRSFQRLKRQWRGRARPGSFLAPGRRLCEAIGSEDSNKEDNEAWLYHTIGSITCFLGVVYLPL